MIILPAIDIKDGKAVRLYQGDFDTAEQVADDIIETAKSFEEIGADWIHVVDLDGAYAGRPVNIDKIREIIGETSLNVEVGGGIRTIDTIDDYIDVGAKRVILGSVALSNPELVVKAVEKYKDMIAVSIDSKDGLVKSSAWTEKSETYFLDFAKEMDDIGVRTIIHTDIEKDGTLEGPNKENLEILNRSLDANIIASGGVHHIDDITLLASMGIYGVITGKAIYSGKLDLAEALDIGRNHSR